MSGELAEIFDFRLRGSHLLFPKQRPIMIHFYYQCIVYSCRKVLLHNNRLLMVYLSFSIRKDIQCIRVITMKKTEFITLRTDAATKAILEKLAAEKKWSISQLTEEIIQQWLKEHAEEQS